MRSAPNAFLAGSWIIRVPLAGGEASKAGESGWGQARGVAADDSSLYWVEYRLSAGAHRIARSATGAPDFTGSALLASAYGGSDASLAIGSADVFWTIRDASRSMLGKVPKAGGSAVVLSEGEDYFSEVIADDANIYWAEERAGQTLVKRMPQTGGTEQVLTRVNNIGLVSHLVSDGRYLYFSAGLVIWRLALPE